MLDDVVDEALQTVRVTVAPVGTFGAPAAGFWLSTVPFCEAEQLVDAVVAGVSCAPVIAEVAWVWVWPTTFGTVAHGPDETTRLIDVPGASWVPAAGLVLLTTPLATPLVEHALVVLPTVSCAVVIFPPAAAGLKPATLGTATELCAAATVRCTTVPLSTLVCGAMLCVSTVFAGWLLGVNVST